MCGVWWSRLPLRGVCRAGGRNKRRRILEVGPLALVTAWVVLGPQAKGGLGGAKNRVANRGQAAPAARGTGGKGEGGPWGVRGGQGGAGKNQENKNIAVERVGRGEWVGGARRGQGCLMGEWGPESEVKKGPTRTGKPHHKNGKESRPKQGKGRAGCEGQGKQQQV